MSCNGCRVLRKGCGDQCVLRPCLEWIKSPVAQGHATLFLAKFFGLSDLINFISAVPSGHQSVELFKSLLYEAVGRTVNPVNGAMGLLSTGNWHLCEAGVQTVFDGGMPASLGDENLIPQVDESSEVFQGAVAMMMIGNRTNGSNSNAVSSADVMIPDDDERNLPKLLSLFK